MLVAFRGSGEMASGCAHRLFNAGFSIVMTELARPLAVRRQVSFAQAVIDGEQVVEGVRAVATDDAGHALTLASDGIIAVYYGNNRPASFHPDVLVDATLAKVNTGTTLVDAPIVIGLGPGFTAGQDVHAVIETNRGHDLGRIYYQGSAAPNTSEPGAIMGVTRERVLKAPVAGVFQSELAIGDNIEAGAVFGHIGEVQLTAKITGVVRGLLLPGTRVQPGTKLGDIDPRGDVSYCATISDKARTISGGVLEAILHLKGGGANRRVSGSPGCK